MAACKQDAEAPTVEEVAKVAAEKTVEAFYGKIQEDFKRIQALEAAVAERETAVQAKEQTLEGKEQRLGAHEAHAAEGKKEINDLLRNANARERAALDAEEATKARECKVDKRERGIEDAEQKIARANSEAAHYADKCKTLSGDVKHETRCKEAAMKEVDLYKTGYRTRGEELEEANGKILKLERTVEDMERQNKTYTKAFGEKTAEAAREFSAMEIKIKILEKDIEEKRKTILTLTGNSAELTERVNFLQAEKNRFRGVENNQLPNAGINRLPPHNESSDRALAGNSQSTAPLRDSSGVVVSSPTASGRPATYKPTGPLPLGDFARSTFASPTKRASLSPALSDDELDREIQRPHSTVNTSTVTFGSFFNEPCNAKRAETSLLGYSAIDSPPSPPAAPGPDMDKLFPLLRPQGVGQGIGEANARVVAIPPRGHTRTLTPSLRESLNRATSPPSEDADILAAKASSIVPTGRSGKASIPTFSQAIKNSRRALPGLHVSQQLLPGAPDTSMRSTEGGVPLRRREASANLRQVSISHSTPKNYGKGEEAVRRSDDKFSDGEPSNAFDQSEEHLRALVDEDEESSGDEKESDKGKKGAKSSCILSKSFV